MSLTSFLNHTLPGIIIGLLLSSMYRSIDTINRRRFK